MKVNGKVIVVTGAGSGMGRELTLQLVKKGARVAIADINTESMAETATLAGIENVSTHTLNVADQKMVQALPEEVIARHGTVDGLINNAGIIQPFINVVDLNQEKIERIMNVNFYGTLNMTNAFLPHLIKRPEAHILNVSSMGGFIPFPGQTIYGASKAAIKLLTEGLYAELKDTKVGVSIAFPGAVNTNIMLNSGVSSHSELEEMKKEESNMAMSADAAAKIMIEAIEKNKFRILVGKDAQFLDLFYRLAPRMAVNFITKQMSKMKR